MLFPAHLDFFKLLAREKHSRRESIVLIQHYALSAKLEYPIIS